MRVLRLVIGTALHLVFCVTLPAGVPLSYNLFCTVSPDKIEKPVVFYGLLECLM